MEAAIIVENLHKEFVLHVQGGAAIPVFSDLSLTVHRGECVALYGHSGSGKSTLLRSLYANYKPRSGKILVRHNGGLMDLVSASPREIIHIRRETIGYVSQFLRVIPRVSALDVVAEPLRARGVDPERAEDEAAGLLRRLRIPERLWNIAPATFSGGEQQRINLARGFAVRYPIMLLDEPTASLDRQNRETVLRMIMEAKTEGAAVVGIFHDDEIREAAADRIFDMEKLSVT